MNFRRGGAVSSKQRIFFRARGKQAIMVTTTYEQAVITKGYV